MYKVYGTGAVGKDLPKRKYLGGVLEGGKSFQDGQDGVVAGRGNWSHYLNFINTLTQACVIVETYEMFLLNYKHFKWFKILILSHNCKILCNFLPL